MEIEEINVAWHPKTRKLNQIPKQGLEYAWVSDDNVQIHQLVWCKDFMQDAVYGFLQKKEVSIYGFRYDPATDPAIGMKRARMMIANWKDPEFGLKVQTQMLPFLNAIEKRLRMAPTFLQKCSKVPPVYKKAGVYVLNSHPGWMLAPTMVSLYTLMVRVGMVHDPRKTYTQTINDIKSKRVPCYYPTYNWGDSDRESLKKTHDAIKHIFRHGYRKVFGTNMMLNYPLAKTDNTPLHVSDIHDRFGLRGFSDSQLCKLAKVFPHWILPETSQ